MSIYPRESADAFGDLELVAELVDDVVVVVIVW
jgi:hypothetical protein